MDSMAAKIHLIFRLCLDHELLQRSTNWRENHKRSKRNTRSKHSLFNCSWWLISTSCLLRWVSQPIPEASATAAAASGGGRWSREGRVWSRADPTKAAWSSPFPAWSFLLGCGWLHPDTGCVLLCCCCGGFCCFPFLASVSYRGFPPCTHN